MADQRKGWMMMRGFSSSFPRGAAGAGLVLLRLAACLQLLCAGGCGGVPWWQAALAAALALILGLGMLTPVAALLCALYQLVCLGGLAYADWPQAPPLLSAALTALALAGTGPGAYAVDARLFGRRRLVLPQAAAPPDHDRF